MGSINKTPNFFRHKPLFGFDIGKSSLKVTQIALSEETKQSKKSNKAKELKDLKLIGYGATSFDGTAIEDGVIVQPELIAKAAQDLFKNQLVGDITTDRVAMAIPSYRTFTRSIQLPVLPARERAEAVRLEIEQYIPLPIEEMYLDYTIVSESDGTTEVLAVAVPKTIVDSYLELAAIMGLEAVLIESTMSAVGRMFSHDQQSDVTSLIIDFGTVSSDISIYDGGILTTGTVEGGGQVFNNVIQKGLGVSASEAAIIKTKYGLSMSKRQKEIETALEPTLEKIVKEVKRLMRYHSEHYGNDRPIQQIITLGGGANMPGLSDYLTSELRLAARTCDPWRHIDLSGLQPPNLSDRSMYATAIGLSLAPPHGVFK